jgi:hypothetical protein
MRKMLCFLLVMTVGMAYITSCKKESSINPKLNALGLRDTLTDTLSHPPTDSLPTDSVPHHPHDTIPHNPHDTVPHFPHDTVPFPPHDTVPNYPPHDSTTYPPYPPYYPPIDSFPTHDSLSRRHG